jgi:very-short-patch-repair endonuclease
MAKSELEETLLLLIRAEGLPEPEREYMFAKSIGRRWRLDFAYPEKRIGIEVQGGTYIRGAHSRGTGLERDYEKYNQAQVLGWDVYQFSRKMIESGEAIETIKRVLESEE